MRIRFGELWTWKGTIDRGAYALIGFVGFAIKHNLDRLIAWKFFHRPWGLWNYWIPFDKAANPRMLPHGDAMLLLTLVLCSLPFVWVGVMQTLRRLRSIDVPLWLAVFFFAPYFNLAFFLVLSIVPSREDMAASRSEYRRGAHGALARYIPASRMGSAAVGVALTSIIGFIFVALSVNLLGTYGWTLFLALPFCMGMFSVLIYGYHEPRNFQSCIGVALLSVLIVGMLLVATAIEGVLCLAMALPIGFALAVFGAAVGYFIQKRPGMLEAAPATYLVVLLIAPMMMGAEAAGPKTIPQFTVRTRIEINAPPEIVWQRLVSFPTLPAPTEWPFRIGIAYPIRSTLIGTGVGAQRDCQFSSGRFIEPIAVWEENRQLKFKIAEAPPVMEEMSPYGHIHTRHVDEHYFQAHEAEFDLTPLPGGRTLLEGTSVYENRMWPGAYWRLWSDSVVHHIHLRVFGFIKQLAEADARKARAETWQYHRD